MEKRILAGVLLGGLTAPAWAADLGVSPLYRPIARPVYSWTGCNVGANLGGGASPKTWSDPAGLFGPPGYTLGSHNAHGVAGGGQLGCDYQFGPVVFGLQGLYDLTGMKAYNQQPGGLPNPGVFWNNTFVQSIGTVTGRIGFTLQPTLLDY